MNLTGHLTYNSAVDNEKLSFETKLHEILLICGGVLGFNVIIYIISYFLKKFKTTKCFLKSAINYMRPVLGGFVLGMRVLKRNRYIGLVKPYELLIYYFMNFFPVIQIILSLVFMSVWILYKFIKTELNHEDRQYNAVCLDEENSINLESLGGFRRKQVETNQILSHKLIMNLKLYNNVFAPKLILCFIFLNSFYAGLGFDAFRKIEFFEIIILVHKFFEVYFINYAFEKIKPNKYIKTIFTILCFLLTPLGIFLRNYMELLGTSFYIVSSNVLSNTMFYNSLVITTLFENFIPLPETSGKIILNFILFIFFSVVSEALLNNFFSSY
jgi:hypothetical protein